MEYSLFKDFVVIFGLAVLVIFIFQRLRIPTIIGFLVTGIVAGPNVLALIQSVKDADAVADVGIVLLMFAIGIAFSLKRLADMKKAILIAGAVQVLATAAGVMGFYRLPGGTTAGLAFVGILVALSSPALVMKRLDDRSEVSAPHGQAALGILFFQGMLLVPFILLSPLLARGGWGSGIAPYVILAKIAGMLIVIIGGMKWVVPFLLNLASRVKSREFLMMTIIGICLLTAWAAHRVGLSAGMAAFLAGLVLSETEYGVQVFPGIQSLRDVCAGLFFVSVGMLLNPAIFVQRPLTIVVLTVALVILKSIAGTLSVVALRYPLATAVSAGMALFQVGEFSFILSRFGIKYNILTGQGFQIFLAISIITLAIAPLMFMLAPRAVQLASFLPLPRWIRDGAGSAGGEDIAAMSGHLVIIGFGLNGRNLARAAKSAGIAYAVIEANLNVAREARAAGELVVFGDASQTPVLERARVRDAKVIALTVDDFVMAGRIAEQARSVNPLSRIVARSHHFDTIKPLLVMGVNKVIPEDFEISMLIFANVLSEYQIPRRKIDEIMHEVRADEYGVFRNLSRKEINPDAVVAAPEAASISEVMVPESSALVARTVRQLPVGRRYRCYLLALGRAGKITPHPTGEVKVQGGDVLYLISEEGKRIALSDLLGAEE